MYLTYNGVALHDLGELTFSIGREFEGAPEAPQRAKVTLRVSLYCFEDSYEANATLLRQAREALRTQHGVLNWTDPDTGHVYVNQTATLLSDELPNEWGTYDMVYQLVFSYYEHDLVTQHLPLRFKQTGSNDELTLTHVAQWAESASVERFSSLRAHRKEVAGKVTVTALVLADATAPLATRRTALTAALAKYRAQMNGKEGTLQFGTGGSVFNRVVRIESFTAEVNQLAHALTVNFTAGYTLFPNEADYATVEYMAEQRDAMSGEEGLGCSGKISAPTEAAAVTKLTALVVAVTTQYGYATPGSQQLRLDRTAATVSANADGDTFIEMAFSGEWRKFRSTNQQATFTRTGNTTAVSFGQVRLWDLRYTARRFHEARSQRQHAGGVIEASGTWLADPALNLADRRASLLAQQQAMLTEVNGADGRLEFAGLPGGEQVVRVEVLTAQINQAERGIDWTCTATYSLFPDEAGYATAEFTVATRAAVEDGDEYLTLAGKIQAQNGAAARAKLETLRTSLLALYTYAVTQRLRQDVTLAGVDANGDATATLAGDPGDEGLETGTADGVSFIELTFSEEYRKRASNLVSSNWQINRTDDPTTGLVNTTYSGSVTASGGTAAAAYAAALARAEAIGRNQEAALTDTSGGGSLRGFLRRAQINWEQRQTTATAETEFVRLTFTYEYQSKLSEGRAYLEVNTSVVQDTFGADSETVSGFVVAKNFTAARTFYESNVRSLYNGELIRNESTSTQAVQSEAAGGAFTAQELRLEFNFATFKAKAASALALRYSMSVTRDFLACEKQTNLRGSVYARNRAAADTALEAYLTELELGSPLRDERTEDREWQSGGADTDDALSGCFLKLDFAVSYTARLEGVSGLLEFRLSEDLQYSGTRWAVQALPFSGTPPEDWNPHNPTGLGGVSIIQPTGLSEGARTVRGSVTAATRATCEDWAKERRTMLTGTYPLPERWEWESELVPRTQGVLEDTGTGEALVLSDVRLHRLNFTFAEIVPELMRP